MNSPLALAGTSQASFLARTVAKGSRTRIAGPTVRRGFPYIFSCSIFRGSPGQKIKLVSFTRGHLKHYAVVYDCIHWLTSLKNTDDRKTRSWIMSDPRRYPVQPSSVRYFRSWVQESTYAEGSSNFSCSVFRSTPGQKMQLAARR